MSLGLFEEDEAAVISITNLSNDRRKRPLDALSHEDLMSTRQTKEVGERSGTFKAPRFAGKLDLHQDFYINRKSKKF